MMGPEYFMHHGGMFMFPLFFMIVVGLVVYLIFGRRRKGHHCKNRRGSESALEVLKKRYAKGEVTPEEFEKIKQDIV